MANAQPAPKHLWIVGIITLLWNLMGAFDYLMTQTKAEWYMGQFEQAQLDYFYSFPTLLVVFWALAVWGGVLGNILLLLRNRLATPVFVVSFVSMAGTAVYNYGFSNSMEVTGSTGLIFTVVIFIVALGLVLYSRAMCKQGVFD